MNIIKNNDDNHKVVISKNLEQEIDFKKLGSIKYQKGHTIFEYDTETGKLNKASFNDSEIRFDKNPNKRQKTHKLIMKKHCFYISALNEKNAFRKLNNHFK